MDTAVGGEAGGGWVRVGSAVALEGRGGVCVVVVWQQDKVRRCCWNCVPQ